MTPLPLALKPALDAIGQAVDTRFDRLLALPDDPRRPLYQAMRHSTIGGGKRMRPLLVVAACDLFGVDRERALRVALAVEAVHCYSLVHDDLPCMDDDDVRRGKPTVHREFGEAVAVLTGDALFALAFELLATAETHEDPFVRSELVLELARAAGAAGMAGGQMLDIAAVGGQFDLPTTTRLQQMKTGALFGFCVDAGCIMGKASPAVRLKLRGYAHDLGLAFQIADDILDIEGDSGRTGKALRKDMVQGKSTFVSLLGLDRARTQAEMLIDQAIHHLHGFGPDADLLRAIARFTIERDC
jgi:farnesyl diphosphate synthase